MTAPPSIATDAVLVKSEAMPEDSETVRGYDFNNGIDYHELLKSYTRSGFQALNFGKAVMEINKMVSFNPFMPIGFFYFNSLGKFISCIKGVWLVFIIVISYRNI